MPLEQKAISSSQMLFNIVLDTRCEAFTWVADQKLALAVRNDDLDESLEVAQGCHWSWEEWDGFVNCLNHARDIVRYPVAFTDEESELEKVWKELDQLTTIMDRFEQLVGCYLDHFIL